MSKQSWIPGGAQLGLPEELYLHSLSFTSNQLWGPARWKRISGYLPETLPPKSWKVILYAFQRLATHSPWSQILTFPAPYLPRGISPSKIPKLRPWSSTWTANWRILGEWVKDFRNTQLLNTPFFSRRKSYWCVLTKCSWMTNLGLFIVVPTPYS